MPKTSYNDILTETDSLVNRAKKVSRQIQEKALKSRDRKEIKKVKEKIEKL